MSLFLGAFEDDLAHWETSREKGLVAHRIEHQIPNLRARGSNPLGDATSSEAAASP